MSTVSSVSRLSDRDLNPSTFASHWPLDALQRRARFADLVMLGALGLYALIAVALGLYYGAFALAVTVSAVVLLLAGLVYRLLPGTVASRLVLSVLAMTLVALHIQLARGLLETHFGVFVTLALLLVYLDWRPLLSAALFIAVHHLLFDRLQAAGLPVYCMTMPDISRILLHAGYVVIQTSIEVVIAVFMARTAREGYEMERLMQHVGRDGRFYLDVEHLRVTQPRAVQLQQMLGQVRQVIDAAREATRMIGEASQGIAEDSRGLASHTRAQAEGLARTSENLARCTEALRGTLAAVAQVSPLVVEAGLATRRGDEAAGAAEIAMRRVAESAGKVAEMASVIDGIAAQTNLLSLNAAVEAARAGSHGKGFAVVAGEVRTLSQRSGQSARDVREIVGTTTESVRASQAHVEQASVTMREVNDVVARVQSVITDIAQAAHGQEGQISQVNHEVERLEQSTRDNAALAEHAYHTVNGLREEAARLVRTMEAFHGPSEARTALASSGARGSAPARGSQRGRALPLAARS